jgi:hypothetical protein
MWDALMEPLRSAGVLEFMINSSLERLLVMARCTRDSGSPIEEILDSLRTQAAFARVSLRHVIGILAQLVTNSP